MRIFILGLGFCGSTIAERLRQDGHEVVGWSRSGRGQGQVLAGDVLADGAVRSLFHLAPFDLLVCAISGSREPDPHRYRALYVDAPRRVADALPWNGPRRIWFLGSTGVFGVTDGSWVNEQTPAHPLHPAGMVQLAAEKALLDVSDMPAIFRLSGLYGPGRCRLIRQALRRRPYFHPDLWSNQIHRDDVAGLLAFFAAKSEPPPPLLLVSDDRPALRREIFDWIRAATGFVDGLYDEDHPTRDIDRGNKRISNDQLKALGYKLLFPDYRTGLLPLLPKPA